MADPRPFVGKDFMIKKKKLGLFYCWADFGTKLQTHAQSYGMPNIVSNVVK